MIINKNMNIILSTCTALVVLSLQVKATDNKLDKNEILKIISQSANTKKIKITGNIKVKEEVKEKVNTTVIEAKKDLQFGQLPPASLLGRNEILRRRFEKKTKVSITHQKEFVSNGFSMFKKGIQAIDKPKKQNVIPANTKVTEESLMTASALDINAVKKIKYNNSTEIAGKSSYKMYY